MHFSVYQELGVVMRKLGHRPTDLELKNMVEEVDLDNSGTIEMDEFLRMMANRVRDQEINNKQINTVFSVFDKNSDGSDSLLFLL